MSLFVTPSPYKNIRIVLVHTTHPGNIGAVARAMKNMGLSELVLVSPKEFPSERAEWRAVNANELLQQAKVVNTIDKALAGCGLVVGTSARDRRIPWPLFNPRECGARVIAEAATHPVAIVFGREDRGLTNEELHKCHYHVHIPGNDDYPVLNLAMAVQVICYELRMAVLAADGQLPTEVLYQQDWDQPPATADEIELFFRHLEQVMTEIGFHEPENPRQTLTRLRRLFNRIRPDRMETNILRGFLTAVEDKTKK
jgi:tRNA (cytidine32/uridine32-2'-O)-methyltransferase